jgi:hypothetical protein
MHHFTTKRYCGLPRPVPLVRPLRGTRRLGKAAMLLRDQSGWKGASTHLAILKDRDHGLSYADDLADLANEALAQADEMDRRDRASARPPVTEVPQEVTQQHNRPNPTPTKKSDVLIPGLLS